MAKSLTYSIAERQGEPTTSTDLSIVLLGGPSPRGRTKNENITSKLLEIPQELRERIYEFINDDILKSRIVAWNINIVTNYDGLRFACRQLYEETRQRIFKYRITGQQPGKLFTVPLNKATFQELRTLTIEIDHNAENAVYAGFCEALNCLQLTIQELHILFVGKDSNGVDTKIFGCGNLTAWDDNFSVEQEPLLLSGQHVNEKKFNLYRQLSLMRQLRILRVRNANIPLIHGVLLVNKPHLKALSVVCDPRTVFHTYRTVPRHLLKGLMTATNHLPKIKVLELTANAMVPASDTVIRLAQNLEHLTWIVPSFDYQRQAGSCLSGNDFYEEVAHLVRTLPCGTPKLWTLRLCISKRETTGLSSGRTERDLELMGAYFRSHLPRFQKLQHLEIHYCGGRGFFRNNLIAHLPPSLKRLYITDSTTSPIELQEQVWRRYFHPSALREEEGSRSVVTPVDGSQRVEDHKAKAKASSELVPGDEIIIAINEYGFASYSTKDELQQETGPNQKMLICYRKLTLEDDNDCLTEAGQFCGERNLRGDATPVHPVEAGCLGCITYEYACTEIDGNEGNVFCSAPDDEWESDTTIILRLCGKLLDRERHLHLSYQPSLRVIEGIRPKLMSIANALKQAREESPETARHSSYANICLAIHNERDLQPKQSAIKENNQALSDCLGEHWYFGDEDEAMKVFQLEPSAKVESQRPRSTLDVVVSVRDSKCRWMSPDYDLSPVGFFPAPPIPRNWQSRLHK